MKPFIDWLKEASFDHEPWLILGKGPSFSKLASLEPRGFRTIALNHAVRECVVDVAHAIDIEVIEQCGTAIDANARFLVMPWIPHVRSTRGIIGSEVFFKPSDFDLMQWCARIPVLRRLSDAGRLLWYNLATAPKPHLDQPVIRAKGFSASAVVNLLAEAGVKRVRTLGVDGGSAYSAVFDDLKTTTLLQTPHQSFDIQFEEIARCLYTRALDLAPLDVEQPLVVYVGTEPEQMLAVRVLEHSIRRHTSMNVVVRPLFEAIAEAGIDIPMPRHRANAPRTPFSFQRFAIPALKAYRGRAIYLDSDMLVFDDLRQLWRWPMDGNQLLAVQRMDDSERSPQFSVMVLDCEALAWNPEQLIRALDDGKWTYDDLMKRMAPAERIGITLPRRWNELERYTEGETALLHFTDMNTQPWLSADNVHGHLWCAELIEALEAKFIDPDLVREHVHRGWVRPSLLHQIDHRIVDPLLLPAKARNADGGFVPPHRRLRAARRRLESPHHAAQRLFALSRHLFTSSGAKDLLRRVRRRVARIRARL
jgi:hypothetical protein